MVAARQGFGTEATTWSAAFDQDPAVIYELDFDFRVRRCNRGWDVFALENNGYSCTSARVIGTFLFDVISPDLRPFYLRAFKEVKEGREWSHMFQCSSAAVIRQLRMRIVPAATGFITMNELVEERLQPPPEGDSKDAASFGPVVSMCANCRRVLNHKQNTWQWVPDFVAHMPISAKQVLCPPCYAHHYPEQSLKPELAHLDTL
jgi:hypothetical protein